jgi:MYXO-CTERM domain-containing protein
MRGWVLNADGTFTPDRAGDPALTDEEVRSLAATPGQEASYTCVPPGSGIRMGIDRDEDGVLNGDESKDSSSPSGCGCTVTSRGDGVLRWFALLALGLAARASRRRMAR